MRTVLGPGRPTLVGAVLATVLAAVLAALLGGLLAGCGDEQVGRSPEPGASGPPPRVLAIVSGPATGEEVGLEPVDVSHAAALRAFVAPMAPSLADEVTAAVHQHQPTEGTSLAAAVIAIGCEIPPSATVVEDGEAGWRVVPAKVDDPLQECFAAQASVAVVEIPLPRQ